MVTACYLANFCGFQRLHTYLSWRINEFHSATKNCAVKSSLSMANAYQSEALANSLAALGKLQFFQNSGLRNAAL